MKYQILSIKSEVFKVKYQVITVLMCTDYIYLHFSKYTFYIFKFTKDITLSMILLYFFVIIQVIHCSSIKHSFKQDV